jgi:hypothetical protein
MRVAQVVPLYESVQAYERLINRKPDGPLETRA